MGSNKFFHAARRRRDRESQTVIYSLSDGKKIQKVTDVVTGNGIGGAGGEFSASVELKIMTMRISAVCFHLAVLFIANGCAVQQQKFEPTGASMRQAIARGEAKEFLVALEVMGSEAEKKGRWAEASMAYTRASAAARETGQLQKAIAHGTAAVEMAQRAKDALAQSSAIRRLGGVYNSLGQFEREREWLQRGLEVAKQISGDRKEGEQAIL